MWFWRLPHVEERIVNVRGVAVGLAITGSLLLSLLTGVSASGVKGRAVCTKIARQIATDQRNGREWRADGTDAYLLHLAGCDERNGSYQYGGEGVQRGACNLRAYKQAERLIKAGRNLAADDGMLFGVIFDKVVGRTCGAFEDGTYYGR